MKPAQKALRFILSRPHPPQNAEQVEQCGRDHYFNSQRTQDAYPSYQDAGSAIRNEFENPTPPN